MKKQSKTKLIFIADRSGSMDSMAKEVIGGFNAFVATQKEQAGEASLTYIQFDNEYEVVHEALPIKDVPQLTSLVYSPRGMTALYDTVGRAITEGLKNAKEGDLTVMNIITDGQENASKEYSYETVKTLIKLAQDAFGWEIVFLGANMDARAYAGDLGIKGKNIATFDASSLGATAAINTMNYASTSYRGVHTGAATADMSTFASALDTSKALEDVYKKSKDRQ